MQSTLPEPIRDEELEAKPKKLLLAKGYADRVGLSELSKKNPDLTKDLSRLRECIIKGYPLDGKFYRKGKDVTPDGMLKTYGIMHVHLGGQNSNVIVYLMQFADHVVLLEIGNHYHFTSKPPGSQLDVLHGTHVRMQVEIEKAAQRLKIEAATKALLQKR